jgi:predicted ABC-class ATPase
MDEFIARANIEEFRKQLSREQDEAKRKTLSQLLADEGQKLAEAVRRKKAEKDNKHR